MAFIELILMVDVMFQESALGLPGVGVGTMKWRDLRPGKGI